MGWTGYGVKGQSPALWLVVCLLTLVGAARAQEMVPVRAVLADAPQAQPGVVRGSVVDADGDEISGAKISLTPDGKTAMLTTVADEDGEFTITGVPAGHFRLTASSEGLESVTVQGTVAASGEVQLEEIALKVATAEFSVSALSPHDAAEVEVKQEESQRLLGVLPNFGISYNWNAPPLDTKQKFELATRSVIDPTTLAINAGIVMGERWSGNFQEFGTGPSGYWYLYGVTLADIAVGNELGGAIFPTLFHQDPRYFWKGSGSAWSRAKYAVSRSVICRGDNGKNQFSWSGVLGDLGAGAFSNVYYPAQDRRGATLTFVNGALDIASDAANNLVQEFIFKHITPKAKSIPSTAPDK